MKPFPQPPKAIQCNLPLFLSVTSKLSFSAFALLVASLHICTLFSSSPAHAILIAPVEKRIASTLQRHHRVVAVFDLDETLIHSTARKAKAYALALNANDSTLIKQFPSETKIAQKAFNSYGVELFKNLKNEYDSISLLKQIGINNVEFAKQLDSLMLSFYLGHGDLIALDKPVQGTGNFISNLYKQNAQVYFVSSRFVDTQFEGTLLNLVEHHLYKRGQSFLYLRNRGESSIDFKARVFTEIKNNLAHQDEVTLIGENEPENMNIMMQTFTGALPLFRVGAIQNTNIELQNRENVLFYRNLIPIE